MKDNAAPESERKAVDGTRAGAMFRLAVVTSHPVQYQAPLFQELARHPAIEATVYYGHDDGLNGAVDTGFGIPVTWDRPLLEGYRFRFLTRGTAVLKVSRTFANLPIVWELWRQRYDAVLIHGYATALSLFAYVGAWASGTPVLLRTESELLRPRKRWIRWAKRAILYVLFRHTAAFLCIGNANRDFFRHYGVANRKLFQTPYCVDNGFFTPSPSWRKQEKPEMKKSLGLRPDPPVIVFSGKLIDRKRPLDLAEAYARVVGCGIDATLLYIGEGVLRRDLEAFFTSRELTHVLLAGFQNQTQLPKYYGCGDVFVLPAQFESWGLVVNEAMLFGMPAIVTDIVGAGYDLVEPGMTGYVYKVGDIEQLTLYLSELLSNPGKRAAMGNAAQTRVCSYSYEACVQGIVRAVEVAGRRH